MWQAKNASLQHEVCELTARMYEERERSLCLELCLKEMERKAGGRGSVYARPGPGSQVRLRRQPIYVVITTAPVLALTRACRAKTAKPWPSL